MLNRAIETPFLKDVSVTDVICESLKQSYSVQDFLNSQTMGKASIVIKELARQDDFEDSFLLWILR